MSSTAAPIFAAINSLNGIGGTDAVVSSRTLADSVVHGTTEAGSTVELNFGDTVGSATVELDGTWAYALLGVDINAIGQGTGKVITATATAGGTSSATTTSYFFSLDTLAPFTAISAIVVNANDATVTGVVTEAGSTVVLAANGNVLGNPTVDGSGNWNYTLTLAEFAVIGPGPGQTLVATGTDAYGNTASSTKSFSIDGTAPAAPTISTILPDSGTAGDHITNATVLTVSGAAEANVTVTVFDGAGQLGTTAADGTGAWSFVTGTLVPGSHSFTATATDAASNTGAASAPVVETIDTTAPAAPTISTILPDSGTAGDHITNATVLTVSGAAEANVTVTVFDGAGQLGTTAADGTGAWSFVTGTLVPGSHSFTATATDAASNTGAASAPVVETIDTTAPAAPTISTILPDSGTAGDHITNATVLTVSGTAEANVTVTVFDGAGQLGTTAADGTGAWSFVTGTLVPGSHSFTATATDAASNTGAASAPVVETIDTTAPAAPTISTILPDSGTAGDHITNATVLTVSGAAEANVTVTVFDGAGQLGTTAADGTGAWSFVTGTLVPGSHSFTATATDATSNTGAASAPVVETIDTTAPAAPTISTILPDSGTAGDHITNATVLTVSGTAEANVTVTVFDGAGQLGTTAADGTGAWSFVTGTLVPGSHSFTATATDAASNTGAASAPVVETIDTTAPAAPTISTILPDSGTAGDHITNATVLTVSGTAEANVTVTVFDGAGQLGTTAADGTGAWSFVTGTLVPGSHSFTATATDATSNTGAASAPVVETIDTTAPAAPTISTILPDSGTAGDHITNATVLTVSGTAEANVTVTVFDGAGQLGTTAADGTGAWSFVTGTLVPGSHSFTATATDAASNTGAASAPVVEAIDTLAPTAIALTASPSDAVLGAGASVALTLGLSGTVTVANGTPTLSLNNGGTATYVSGSGTDALMFSYTVAGGQAVADLAVTGANLNGADVTDSAGNVADLAGAAGNPAGTLDIQPDSIAAFDTTTNQPVGVIAQAYTGPVADLQNEYITITNNNVNVSAGTPNWFIHTGSGDDAIAVNSGTNVLDGGTGSNFLVGGSGTDTFFVDNRGAVADIWGTVVNFHGGDAVTIWGVTPADFNFDFEDNQGAAGYTGLTLHATAPGRPTASVTFPGFTTADLANGRIAESSGTEPVSGSTYTYFHAIS